MLIDDVLVSFTIPGSVTDELWDAYIAEILARRPRYCLALCLGAVQIDGAQRRRSTHALVRTRATVVVLTDNRTTRGLAMAVAWFGAKLDAFSWRDLEHALARLEVAEATHERLRREALAFYATLRHIDDPPYPLPSRAGADRP